MNPYEPCRKPVITSLCRIRLLTPDLTSLTYCLRNHNFDLRGAHGHIMTYARLTRTGLTQYAWEMLTPEAFSDLAQMQ